MERPLPASASPNVHTKTSRDGTPPDVRTGAVFVFPYPLDATPSCAALPGADGSGDHLRNWRSEGFEARTSRITSVLSTLSPQEIVFTSLKTKKKRSVEMLPVDCQFRGRCWHVDVTIERQSWTRLRGPSRGRYLGLASITLSTRIVCQSPVLTHTRPQSLPTYRDPDSLQTWFHPVVRIQTRQYSVNL